MGLDHSQALHKPPPGAEESRDPPVTYIKIHEGRDVSIGIFVVRSGCKIPLHNHPNMHGLLKVLCGHVDISVYSKVKPNARGLEVPKILQDSNLIEEGVVFPTEKHVLKSANSDHEGLVLTPGWFFRFFLRMID